jgi:hypothetical protein
MVWRLVLISWALAAVSIALYYSPLGPDEPPPPEPEFEPVVEVEPPAPAKPPPPKPPPPPPEPGALIVIVSGGHVARLDAAGWATFPEPRHLLGLQRDPDGAAWAATFHADFVRLDDTGLHPVVSFAPVGEPQLCEAFMPLAPRELWAVCGADVHRYHDGPWTVDKSPREAGPAEPFALGPAAAVALSLDGAGRLWLARSNRLEVRRSLGGWFDAKVPEDDELLALAPGPAGSMYALTRRYLLRYTDELRRPTQIKLATEGEYRHEKFAVSDRGNIVVLSRERLDTAYTQELAGDGATDSSEDWVALTRTTDGASGRFSGARDVGFGDPEAIAIDDRGRVWWAGAAGLAVLGDGEVRRWWRGAVPELLHGREFLQGALTGVLVTAGGPELPVVDESTRNLVRGRIVERGLAKAGVRIELCPKPRARYRRSPCQDQRLHFPAISDDRGTYSFVGVPPGAYRVVVRDGDRWANANIYLDIPEVDGKMRGIPTIDLRRLPP